MGLTLDMLRERLSTTNYENGMRDYLDGKIHGLAVHEVRGMPQMECEYWGNQVYHVRIAENAYGYYYGRCTCATSHYNGECRHMAAAAIAWAKGEAQETQQTDRNMRQVLNTYLRQSQPEEPTDVPVSLTPFLKSSFEPDYPAVSFRVGRERPYVVKNVADFLKDMDETATVTYGKQLTLTHSPGQFDADARQLIELIRAARRDKRYEFEYTYKLTKDQVRFRGETFARFFSLYEQRTVESDLGPLLFVEEDPQITVCLQKKKNLAQVLIKGAEGMAFFGDTFRLYALGDGKIRLCSPAFRKQVFPLLENQKTEHSHAPLTLRLALNDIPSFCACVLPQVRELAAVEDPDGLLEKYTPEECTPCFYLDMDKDTLTLDLRFRYGDRETRWDAPQKDWGSIRRDLPAEQRAKALVSRSFRLIDSDFFLPGGEDAAYTFLAASLPALRAVGEVYISSKLQSRQVKAAPPSVGISVSDGLLTLKLDTGGFPPEELSALYQSLLQRKKYHRLKDGRFLTLDGSGVEKLAEMAQMLQLGKKNLESDTVTMPAFRALYLDGLLSGSDAVTVNRDRSFRQMIRQFRAVEESDYNLPEDLERSMRAYQKTGFRWLKTLESCGFGGILADEMGLGKTIQTIAYLASNPYSVTGMPGLVVCPASLIYNWADEVRRFAPQLSVRIILGPAAQRKQLRQDAGNADLWVTSYELLRQDIEDYAQRKFYCCVLDEGQHIKNQTTQVSKAVKRIDCRQRFVLTGTPIENRLSELWNLFDFLMPGYLFTNAAFRDKLEKPIVKSGNPEAQEQLRKLVSPFILRRLKKDVLKELPPKSEYIRRIQLSEREQKTYYSAVQALRDSIGEEDGKLKILAALTQLRQICCDPALCFQNYEGETSKLDACMELVETMAENGHQILLFSQFTSMLDILRGRLEERGISNFTLRGSTSKEQRARLVKEFNEGKASVFLISLKAGGTGLNLTAADIVIHYDPWWNLAAQEQATDRAHRIGQEAHVQVYKLIAKDTIEERILELQEKKAALMDALSGTTEAGILEMSREELLELLKIG